jgi:SpoVK/Ycf46/Vps4 family AAA+-type ATPase
VADEDLLESLRRAVEASPGDTALRLHLAELLVRAGLADEAVPHLASVLEREPTSAKARKLMAQAMAVPQPAEPVEPTDEPTDETDFDWSEAEEQLGDVAPPMFVDPSREETDVEAWEVERVGIKLDDVGGLADVKQRLELAFLGPLRNPELRRLYGKSLRGGLLLYGPPGCGKSFIARALAGELGAGLISLSIHDVLDMWVGRSEQNLHELFQLARRNAPCVLFVDELDALGQRRSQLHNSAMRTTVNSLLAELDGAETDNEGVFVLGATNHPWDVDTALRRPGRFDRMVLVLPPDEPAREAIFRTHLRDRPVANIDLGRLARSTDGYSGADIAHVCEAAAEFALSEALKTGERRLIEMRDLEGALREVRPSTGPWLEAARNVVLFANSDGSYDDLRAYLKQRKLV